MTEHEEACSVQVIEFCRTHFRKLGMEQFASKLGARPEDIAIAACYAAWDLAAVHKGDDPVSAVEFLRTSADIIERQLMEGTRQ